jgi:RNA polymerase sigma-70 factor (ECF subfamily)
MGRSVGTGVIDASSDSDNLRGIANGEALALGDFYDRHAGASYALALRLLNDAADAEEVVQDVFVHVWRHAKSYDVTRASARGWLLMMTRSRAIDRIRARQARPGTSPATSDPTGLSGLTDWRPAQDRALIDLESVERVKAALNQLPEPMRVALDLAYYQGLTQSAIADQLGEPLGTIKTRMRTALTKLRAALQPAGSQ